MRIVEIASSYPAEIFIQRHFAAVTAAGLEVTLAAKPAAGSLQGKATLSPTDRRDGVLILPDFDRMSWMDKLKVRAQAAGKSSLYRGDLPFRRRVWLAEIANFQPDLIHFHNAQLAASLGWIPAELGLPYTVSVRGADVQEIPLRSRELAQSTRAALEGAVGIQAVCQALAESPLLAGLEVTPIYTTVPLPQALGAYPESAGKLQLVSVGRLHWRKGYPDLLVAVKGLQEEGLVVELTIYGSGSEQDRLKYWIGRLGLDGHVHLAGKTTPEQIRQALQGAHAYVQSSYAEGLSNALAEAMAYGCPVFATDVAGTAEAVEDGVTGRLLPVGEPEMWVGILKSIRDRAGMERMRLAAFLRANEMFSAERHAQAFKEFFERSARDNTSNKIRVANNNTVQSSLSPSGDGQVKCGKVLVQGEWRWQNGIDLLLREFYKQGVFEKFDVYLEGSGPQEDELRYLAELFGLGQEIFVAEGESLTKRSGAEVSVTPGAIPESNWRVAMDGAEIVCEDAGEVVRIIHQPNCSQG